MKYNAKEKLIAFMEVHKGVRSSFWNGIGWQLVEGPGKGDEGRLIQLQYLRLCWLRLLRLWWWLRLLNHNLRLLRLLNHNLRLLRLLRWIYHDDIRAVL